MGRKSTRRSSREHPDPQKDKSNGAPTERRRGAGRKAKQRLDPAIYREEAFYYDEPLDNYEEGWKTNNTKMKRPKADQGDFPEQSEPEKRAGSEVKRAKRAHHAAMDHSSSADEADTFEVHSDETKDDKFHDDGEQTDVGLSDDEESDDDEVDKDENDIENISRKFALMHLLEGNENDDPSQCSCSTRDDCQIRCENDPEDQSPLGSLRMTSEIWKYLNLNQHVQDEEGKYCHP